MVGDRAREAAAEHRFHLCMLPATATHATVVWWLKERGRTERVYQDLKDELGLDHYEGRSWPGWNHHVAVVLCCYALLVGERCVAFPPRLEGRRPRVRTRARPQLHIADSLATLREAFGRRLLLRFGARCPSCHRGLPSCQPQAP